MPTIAERAQTFADLHKAGCFVMPNAWDVGSAQMLAGLGAKAIATASAGLAGTLGLPDGGVGRDVALAHARALVDAVAIPVSADLENCYADSPEGVAETVRLAAETGLAGCSVEDKRHGAAEFYDATLAAERVAAALEAAAGVGRPFAITARADGFLGGGYDLVEALSRAETFAELGAPCVFVPGIPEDGTLARLCAACGTAVSHLTGIDPKATPVSGLAEMGVRRISTGPMLFRVAMGAAHAAAHALLAEDEAHALAERPGWPEANAAMKAGKAGA